MMNTPQLAAQFLGLAICDTARLAARWFITIYISHYWEHSPQIDAMQIRIIRSFQRSEIFGWVINIKNKTG
jgi:hypothetical protein